jgi:NADP-dependent 3-hydroxy acid dehydrogenase YdfG
MRGFEKRRALNGAVVVITGASSGIGRAASVAFARKGARVVLAARDVSALESVALECDACGGAACVVPTDVRYAASVEQLRRAAVEAHGRIDVWVNDAGVYMLGTVEETPPEAVRDLFDTNVLGVLHGSQSAVAQFRAQPDGGVLLNVGSLGGEITYAKASAYCASKHAVHAITEALRQELRDAPIDVCLIAPPSVDTPLFQHSANFTGRLVVALPPLVTADVVADAIVDCAERPRRRVVVGAFPKLMIWAWRLVPRMLERLQPRVVERQHLSPQRAGPSLGNLDHPLAPHSVSGGWEPRNGHSCSAC